ncbi:hypothetical protein [Halorhodospira halophila]|uniref:hypothetical protein n=1 Tax=Halorhodospira halophila TaxID=1053 RepID=UPI0019119E26|nr:hypothetical protein [Halorhodospira halophila]MBK5944831.1 hypothetical protein [Halorhodospira halophila]
MSDYYRLEIEPCVEADDHCIEPGVNPEHAQFWGVYGRRIDTDLAEHIRDCNDLAEARALAAATRPDLPVVERFVVT